MDRPTLAVTTAGLLALVVLFPPPGPRTAPVPTSPASTDTTCPRPGLGVADTDAVLLCLATLHERQAARP